jgi:hypothetical protein
MASQRATQAPELAKTISDNWSLTSRKPDQNAKPNFLILNIHFMKRSIFFVALLSLFTISLSAQKSDKKNRTFHEMNV